MFPGTSYFQTFPCPFFSKGGCDRPYCHFKHIKPDKTEAEDYEYLVNTKVLQHPGYSTGPKSQQPNEEPPPPSLSIAALASGSSGVPSVTTTTVVASLHSAAQTTTTSSPIATPTVTSPAVSSEAITAAMGPLAAVLDKNSLEAMIQNAVRKVLLEAGGGAAQLNIAPPPPSKVEVKEEVDDDIIIEFCDIKPAKSTSIKSENAKEKEVTAENMTVSQDDGATSGNSRQGSGPLLCLPPPNAPQYIPTPIKELEKRKSQETGQNAEDSESVEPTEKSQTDGQGSGSLPSSLIALSSLHSAEKSSVTAKVSSPGKKTFSYEPPAGNDSVLGDIDDMSESAEEEENSDVLASILKAGNSSGVLAKGKETAFEEQVIKEKCKLLKKKLDKKDKGKKTTDEDNSQCDKVTSSSYEKRKEEATKDIEKLLTALSDTEANDEDDQDSSEDLEDKKIREEEEAIKNLEKKRLILENFYKSRMGNIENLQKKDKNKEDGTEKSDKKESSSHRNRSSKSSKKRSSGKERESTERSRHRHSSDHKSSRHRSRSRHRSGKHGKHRKEQISQTESDSSPVKRSHSSRKHKSSSHSKRQSSSKHAHKSRKHKKSYSSSSLSSDSQYDTESYSDTEVEEPPKKKAMAKSDKKERIETKKVKEAEKGKVDQVSEDFAQTSDVNDAQDDNMETEYEEQPFDDSLNEFQRAELKIKRLLEDKMKAPTMGVFSSSYKIMDVKPKTVKAVAKVETSVEDVPDVSVFLKSKPEPKQEIVVKPELKLRALTDLIGSQAPIDPKTQNIFDNEEEESFSDMIKRHESDWINIDNSSTALDDGNESNIAETTFEDDAEAEEQPEQNQTSFLDAISATDKTISKQRKETSKKRDRSKSENKSKEHKKSKESSSSSSRKEDRSSKDSSRRSRDDHRSSSSSKHKKSSSSAKHRRDKSRERSSKKSRESKDGGTPVQQTPDTTVHTDQDQGIPDFSEELDMLPDLDADLDAMFNSEDDAGDDELQRVFNQYKPQDKPDNPATAKLNKQVQPSSSSSEAISSKKRVAHDGSSQDADVRRPLHMRRPQTKTPAQTMLDRFKKIQQMTKHKEMERQLEEMTSDSPAPGPSSSRVDESRPGTSKRVAHQPKHGNDAGPPPVLSKVKQQLLARQVNTTSRYETGTVAQTTAKGGSRVAHTPSSATMAALAKPIITADPKSKVPTNVRQRYLDSITTTCLDIYNGKEEQAYARAEKEETDCCRKASSRMIYLNLVVNKIKKLRTEAKEAEEARARGGGEAGPSSANPATQKRPMLTTHMQVLAGKPGSIGTWSFEKPVKLNDEDIDEELMYNIMKKYVLTEQQLVDNGFPRVDPEEAGKAIVKVESSVKASRTSDPDRRTCIRCKAIYRVDKFGKQIEKEDCIYHWGRQCRRRGNRALGGSVTVFYCCQQGADSTGCQVGKLHVTDVLDYNDMRGFVTTMETPNTSRSSAGKVFALDCEMCYTTQGNELTRVTVIDMAGEVIYESLVKPESEVVDYNTRFSGITEEDLTNVTTSLMQVQAVLLMKFEAKDILIGHSLESDLKALKMIHSTVVDTSVVFPHRMGPPFKIALRFLAGEHLKRIIQNDEGGHDSKEDALACLDLMKMKVKEDVKRLQKKARIQAMYNN